MRGKGGTGQETVVSGCYGNGQRRWLHVPAPRGFGRGQNPAGEAAAEYPRSGKRLLGWCLGGQQEFQGRVAVVGRTACPVGGTGLGPREWRRQWAGGRD